MTAVFEFVPPTDFDLRDDDDDADRQHLERAQPVTDRDMQDLARANPDLRFAAAVAGFGQLLRNDPYLKNFSYAEVASLANGARGQDPFGYRAEFTQLVRLAEAMPAMPALEQGGVGGAP